jgi:uncharacterized membrane protein
MFFWLLIDINVQELVRSNELAFPKRIRLILVTGAAGTTSMAAAVFYGRWRGERELTRLSHRLAPAALLGLLPPLCTPAAGSDPLTAALAFGAVVLLTEQLARLFFEAALEGLGGGIQGRLAPLAAIRWIPVAITIAGAAAYAAYMSVQTLWMHGRFQTYGYDLGQYDNVFWSTLHGYPLHDEPLSCVQNWSELRYHADLSTFFFLPFYAIRPGGPVLLVMQSCALGLGAIPLYRFAARRLHHWQACIVALAFLLYPPMHGFQFHDFHMQPMAVPFILFAIDFVDGRRYVLCAIAAAVALGCREDVSIGLAILGAFLALSGHRVRAGIALAGVGFAYFVTIRFWIMPAFGPTWFQNIYKTLLPEDARSFGGVIATLWSNPAFTFSTLITSDKLRYALQILVPLAFLPLRRSWLAVSLVHGSLLTLFTTKYIPALDIGFQYSANFVPYIFPAAVLALQMRAPARRNAALAAIVVGTLLCAVLWGAFPPRKSFKGGFVMMAMTAPTEADRQKHAYLQELHALVPEDASLATSEPEMPHISRLHMRSLRDTTAADYLLYAVGGGRYGGDNAEKALAAHEFESVAERPGLVLLRRLDYGHVAMPSIP